MLRPTLSTQQRPGPPERTPAIEIVAGRAVSGGAYTVLEARVAPGAGVGAHLHEREDQILVVLDGELTVVVDGVRETLGAGGCIHLPRGVPHRALAGPAGARVLCVCTPGGLEDVVLALQDPEPTLDDLAALLAAAGVHGVPARW